MAGEKLNMDEPPVGATHLLLSASSGAVCPECARVIRTARGAIVTHSHAIERLLDATCGGDSARFAEARGAARGALGEMRSHCDALTKHPQKHEW